MRSLDVRDGTIDVSDGALHAAATDFGRVVRHVPRAVVRPGSVEDVVAVVRWAAEHRVPVAARGAGHSMNGQALVSLGIVVDMTALRAVHSVDRDRVVVDAGTTWSAVLAATLPVGLTPPVLTDYLELTVGGTLSVGGVGGMSFRHGAVTDNVLELEVVTGDGRLRTCSPTDNRDLFDAVRAGLGQFGLLVRATVRLVPAHHEVRCHRLGYDDARTFTADQRRLIGLREPAYVEGYAKITGEGRRRYEVELATCDTPAAADEALLRTLRHDPDRVAVDDLTYAAFLDRLAPRVTAQIEAGEWGRPHPWLNLFLPGSAIDTFLERTMAELSSVDLENFGVVLTYPIPTGRLRTPLMRRPGEPVTFLLALLLTADPDAVTRTTTRARRIYDEARSVGGCLYPVGVPTLTPADWVAHHGTAWPTVVTGKRRWDPARILTPGPGIDA